MTKQAWKRQRALKKEYQDVPDIAELVDIINSIQTRDDFITKRNKALFAMYYLTGCRASELTQCSRLWHSKYERLDNGKWKLIDRWPVKGYSFPGIKKKDIRFEVMEDKECMIIRTENRKNKDKTTKRQPIPIELEQPIVQFVKDYIMFLQDEQILFPFWPTRATQIINQVKTRNGHEFNIHFIRHIRATHLVTKYDFNEQLLVKFMGWSNSMPAKSYMELSSKDMFRQFYKN